MEPFVLTSLDKNLNRKIRMPGVGDIVVTIAPEGVRFRLKGSQREITAPWADVIASCATPVSIPKYLNGEPFAFLQYVGEQIAQRRAKMPPKKSPAKVRSVTQRVRTA